MEVEDDDDGDYVPNPMDEEDEEDELAQQLAQESEADSSGNVRIGAILRTMIELNALSGNTPEDTPVGDDASGVRFLSLEQLLNRVGGFNVAALERNGELAREAEVAVDEEDDDEADGEDVEEPEEEYVYSSQALRREAPRWFKPVTEPQATGVQLLSSARSGQRNIARIIQSRSNGSRRPYREDLSGHLIPNSKGTAVASYDYNVYCGQFSGDSSFYYTCCQDFKLHVYDTTAPPLKPDPPRVELVGRRRRVQVNHEQTTMTELKTIQGNPGQWTVTDSHLSSDNERQVLSSLPMTQVAINFADPRRRRTLWGYDEGFGIWSCRFSADGNEVVAGGSGKIFVYDLLADKRTVKIEAHGDDVNSCCWADTASGNVLISASDDTFLKVWDRRSLGSSPKPSGVLIGHTEGITNVSAKGDGRYVISNGKDQALRLWDLRKMRTNAEYEAVANIDYGIRNFDYRYSHYPKPRRLAHPQDCSVMTYRGHSVMQTLIRCHFSPAETTGGQYLYSGSADGRIHIWSLDGQVVQVLDRSQTLPMTFDPSGPEPEDTTGASNNVCVRDVSWHSREPVLMSAGWESGRGGSMVARHEWKGLAKMPGALEDYVTRHRAETEEVASRRRTILMTAGRENYGFPEGYFVINSVASKRLLDVAGDSVEDGAEVILWPQKESSLVESTHSPTVFFIDTSGALCSRSSGHAIDVEDGRLVLRHRRPVSQPYPNAYSHTLPQFHYSQTTGEITAVFQTDPTYPSNPGASTSWRNRTYYVTSLPERKPRTFIDDAAETLGTVFRAPLTLFGGPPAVTSATDEAFNLREDEVDEQERGDEAEVDDSPALNRKVRVFGTTEAGTHALGTKARVRRQWQVIPLRKTVARPRHSG
ncbi:WD40 repeat-like protein [Auriscalpium vulgare]|uniref:WD40 repeat-like protein n=1 Tax=Auriscalpium vulgare TaxID=40419 RepID=A0ACB8SC15_9AGAM|nr:WD40 repeat-like protein [Auriscalpium vulgare]